MLNKTRLSDTYGIIPVQLLRMPWVTGAYLQQHLGCAAVFMLPWNRCISYNHAAQITAGEKICQVYEHENIIIIKTKTDKMTKPISRHFQVTTVYFKPFANSFPTDHGAFMSVLSSPCKPGGDCQAQSVWNFKRGMTSWRNKTQQEKQQSLASSLEQNSPQSEPSLINIKDHAYNNKRRPRSTGSWRLDDD